MSRSYLKAPALTALLRMRRQTLIDSVCMRADVALEGAWYWRPMPGAGTEFCVVAHVDTVWDRVHRRVPAVRKRGEWWWSDSRPDRSPRRIFRDPKAGVLWAPGGLGADDRAGVWACLELRRRLGAAVLLCDGEESGGIGAREAGLDRDLAVEMRRHKALIEIDRRGRGEAVFYHPPHPDFEARVRSWGFRIGRGSFSDISILGPAWGMDAVNLSAGYHREHSESEYLVESDLHYTVDALSEGFRS